MNDKKFRRDPYQIGALLSNIDGGNPFVRIIARHTADKNVVFVQYLDPPRECKVIYKPEKDWFVVQESSVVACKECKFYVDHTGLEQLMSPLPDTSGCQHTDCFKTKTRRCPIEGEVEVKTRIANCKTLNSGNDCPRFKRK